MPPILILIRHGQALHNVTQNYHLHDPVLSEKGMQECKDLAQHFLKPNTYIHTLLERLQLVVVSPMRRSLQSAELMLGHYIKYKGADVKIDALWQETSDNPCDTGTPLSTLITEFPQYDFSKVDPTYPAKEGPYAFTRQAVLSRGQAVLRHLHRRPESVIAIVSHSGFLRTAVTARKFAPADYRIFDFVNIESKVVDGVEIKWWIKERMETEKHGGGMGWSECGFYPVLAEDFPLRWPVKRSEDEVVEEVSKEVEDERPEHPSPFSEEWRVQHEIKIRGMKEGKQVKKVEEGKIMGEREKKEEAKEAKKEE